MQSTTANHMSDDPKQPAPDPEIPSELRSKLSRPHRPAGYRPKTAGADSLKNKDGEPATPPEEVEEAKPIRSTTVFFKKLAVVLKGKFTRTIIEVKDVRRKGEWIRETREIKVPVALITGADGLPYTTEPVAADETRRIRALAYKDAPAMNPMTGDLTPEFVEWLYLTHPYDAAVRYAGRSTHVQVAAFERTA